MYFWIQIFDISIFMRNQSFMKLEKRELAYKPWYMNLKQQRWILELIIYLFNLF